MKPRHRPDCAHCGDVQPDLPLVWRCKECAAALCSGCLKSQLDCYDLGRTCPGCYANLPDSDGNAPTDWKAIGYGVVAP